MAVRTLTAWNVGFAVVGWIAASHGPNPIVSFWLLTAPLSVAVALWLGRKRDWKPAIGLNLLCALAWLLALIALLYLGHWHEPGMP